MFGEHGIINSTGFLFPSVIDLGLSIRYLTGLRTSSLLRNNLRLVHDVQSMSVIVLFVFAPVVFVVGMVLIFIVGVGVCMVSTVDGVSMTKFLPSCV